MLRICKSLIKVFLFSVLKLHFFLFLVIVHYKILSQLTRNKNKRKIYASASSPSSGGGGFEAAAKAAAAFASLILSS